MEDKIKLLPERVANQIAAGEVVNSPASVVKEMMENAIDAGSSEVIVNFRYGGLELIQIVDDGIGMSPNDARMAFEKHATSKISDANDIYALRTFGFRGEALASIAAVAQVELRSRHRDAQIGTLTTIHGGEFVDQQPAVCESGSQFMVKNLFWNIPARRKFMSKPSTLASHIKTEFKRVVLCNHDVSFELYSDDALIYQLPSTSLAGRIVDVVGRNIKSNLLEVRADTSIVNIRGYIGRPEAARKSTVEQYLFVNGRFFKSAYINSAILNGYDKIINPALNPAFFIYLDISPDAVDVNIHPQKIDVRFEDPTSVWQILNAAIRETLARTGAIPMMDFDSDSAIDIPVLEQGRSYSEPRAMSNMAYNPFDMHSDERVERTSGGGSGLLRQSRDRDVWESGFEEYESSSNSVTTEWSDIVEWSDVESEQVVQGALPIEELHRSKYVVGDIIVTNDHYAWCPIGGNMHLINLKRAKEVTLYRHYLSTLEHKQPVSQTLLFPIEIELSHDEFESMELYSVEFAALGFSIDTTKSGVLLISALPSDVRTDGVERLIYDLLALICSPEDLQRVQSESIAAAVARSVARSFASSYSVEQARELLMEYLSTEE